MWLLWKNTESARIWNRPLYDLHFQGIFKFISPQGILIFIFLHYFSVFSLISYLLPEWLLTVQIQTEPSTWGLCCSPI